MMNKYQPDAVATGKNAASQGLSTAEAVDLLKKYGENRVKPSSQKALLLQFLEQFRNPLVLILLAASGLTALTGDALSLIHI